VITVKYREFFPAALISVVPFQMTWAAEADQSLGLLKQLHVQLEKAHGSSEHRPKSDIRRPDLSLLRGVNRRQLALILGKPDFCVTPETEICDGAMRWAYFFHPFQPPSLHATLPGTTEVKISPGWGGWALEVGASRNDVVDTASWVKQE